MGQSPQDEGCKPGRSAGRPTDMRDTGHLRPTLKWGFLAQIGFKKVPGEFGADLQVSSGQVIGNLICTVFDYDEKEMLLHTVWSRYYHHLQSI